MIIRPAALEDLPEIVFMLADDSLGQQREAYADPLPQSYTEAFLAIEGDSNHQLLVADHEGRPVGIVQLSFLPNLTYKGGWRAQIEGVRVSKEVRGEGVGKKLILEAIARAAERACKMVQLTTDAKRPAARAFYESMGFVASHLGMKLFL